MTNIVLPSRAAINRSIHGDTVAVRFLPRSEWLPGSGMEAELEEDEDVLEAVPEEELAASEGPSGAEAVAGRQGGGLDLGIQKGEGERNGGERGSKVPVGEVVGILQRSEQEVVCCLVDEDDSAMQVSLVL